MDCFPVTGFTGAGGEWDESRRVHDKHALDASAEGMETEMVHLDLHQNSHYI